MKDEKKKWYILVSPLHLSYIVYVSYNRKYEFM